MKEIILCKYGEIALKGLNRNTFEAVMQKNIKHRLKELGEIEYSRSQSTLYVEPEEGIDIDEVVDRLSKVYGIVKLCRAKKIEKTMEAVLSEETTDYLREELENARTFKVNAKRSDKRFPLKSPEICREMGHVICERFPHLTVDVHDPDVTIVVEIRETNAFVHAGAIEGAGGIPIGTSGKALLLLSGGIDSPVAGCMIAKRGATIQAIHFEAPPYTSERARQKVERLAAKMAAYCGDIKFHCVPFTKIQEAIRDNCKEEYFTIIMRRLMMEIAVKIAAKEDIQCLVTGESLGQVASQTMYAMVCTDAVSTLPVFRPCIGMDKSEIVEISRKIDTFETSIEPYEDCCTVFTPKHPKTRPTLADVEKEQARFDFSEMVETAVNNTSAYYIKMC
ncbi:tRNA uracil 4-sulfurtransferase ThiI [Ruminococcus sp. NK3A76]|uniref:tRNA uracil 4-sulfurtransferase ThiI n=1 Tax=Ruminococcus sp. NK3A76 TaxID=877411 RepID=UPI00048E2651|nr:tRNA uracil 4-sulfurtransferase ThiI [Ruminococcus sp. NK3A76]